MHPLGSMMDLRSPPGVFDSDRRRDDPAAHSYSHSVSFDRLILLLKWAIENRHCGWEGEYRAPFHGDGGQSSFLAVRPPSTLRVSPVMKLARSESRKVIASASSAVDPKRNWA